ncbi:hypothetical protein PZB75_00315 [Streptomyces sp. AM 4-1-1]|uniref:hypothetical protein n=1 Tax=Streptomyces sp. AM 4-1-1 TaxID=3028710 RepID=UPI0023B99792|nr:hypothetical protein [Streptomyces sp. AM 4-1-1]WEH31961.1 hypothetical protein PZB75_00315 [Streptomyces sp. AM 4-1-1]
MSPARSQSAATTAAAAPDPGHPFHITKEEERRLRLAAAEVAPSLVIGQPTVFDEYVRQLMVPPMVMDLFRKASSIQLSAWEIEAMRRHLAPPGLGALPEPGLLRRIMMEKARRDKTHPPYIRVACTGRGTWDHWATEFNYVPADDEPSGDIGSPVVLELWPAQHYSPIHSHGNTTGIIHCLAGRLDVMAYDHLEWDATKRGLVTLTPGQCAWLDGDTYAVHKVFCPMDGGGGATGPEFMSTTGEFGASFHVYLNEWETALDTDGTPSRDEFEYIDELNKKKKKFATYSDLSWNVLRRVLTHTDLD